MILNIPHELRAYQFFLVNGIRTKRDIHGWCPRSEVYINSRCGHATWFHYFTFASLRWATQKKHLELMWRRLRKIKKPIIFVGHSNGCELFSRTIRERPEFVFAAAHLFAPAIDQDFDRNGFNHSLRAGQVGHIYSYCSKGDSTLHYWASFSRLAKTFGLGYDSMGFCGAELKTIHPDAKPFYTEHWYPDNYDHNDCYETDFEDFMGKILRI
jgi:predicted alpha/beta hydrolase family esterase